MSHVQRVDKTYIIINNSGCNNPPRVPEYQQCCCGYGDCTDDIQYKADLIKQGVKAPFDGISDIIRAAYGVEKEESTSSSACTSSSCSCSVDTNGYQSYTIDRDLIKREEDLNLELSELEKEIKSLGKKTSTSDTPAVSGEDEDSSSSEKTPDIVKKWSKVDIGYDKAKIDAYV